MSRGEVLNVGRLTIHAKLPITILKKRLTKQIIQRALSRSFAALLLLVWTQNALPLTTIFAAHDESCQMDCCKNLARHPSSSCSGGMCHLRSKKRAKLNEVWCGIEKRSIESVLFLRIKIKQNIFSFAQNDVNQHLHDSGSKLPALQTLISTESCQSTCSFTSTNSGQQNRLKDKSFALSSVERARPPNVVKIEFISAGSIKFPQKHRRRTRSRSPPALFS